MSPDISHLQASLTDAHAEANQYLAGVNSGKSMGTAKFNLLVHKLKEVNSRVNALSSQIAGGGEVRALPERDLHRLNASIHETHRQLTDINNIVSSIITKTPGPQLMAARDELAKSVDNLEENQRTVTDLMKENLSPRSLAESKALGGRVSAGTEKRKFPAKPLPPPPRTARSDASLAGKRLSAGPRPPAPEATPVAGAFARPAPPSRTPRAPSPTIGEARRGSFGEKRERSDSAEVAQRRELFKGMPIMGGSTPAPKKVRTASPPREEVSSTSSSSSASASAPAQAGPQSVPGKKIFELVDYLDKKNDNLKREGLFRQSGNQDKTKALNEGLDVVFNAGKEAHLPPSIDIHVIAVALKTSFGEFCRSLSDTFLDGLKPSPSQNEDQRGAHIAGLVASLSDEQKLCMGKLFSYLEKVEANSADNKMHVDNLAIVFSPNLYKRESEALLNSGNPMSYIEAQGAMNQAFVDLLAFYKASPGSFR